MSKASCIANGKLSDYTSCVHVHKIMDAISVYTEACDIMALPLSLYVQVFPFCPDITAMMDLLPPHPHPQKM